MDIGYQVINEYEILKKILSHLNYKDLLAASKVSRCWKSVADIVIQKNAEIFCAVKRGNEWPDLNEKISPKLILYSNDSDTSRDIIKLTKIQLPAVSRCVEKHYGNVDETIFIYLANWKFINTLKEGKKLVINHSYDDENENTQTANSFKESLLIVPETNDFKIDFDVITRDIMKGSKASIIDKIKNAKCCLFLSNAHDQKGVKIVKSLCEDIEQSGYNLTMAGGISSYMMQRDSGYELIGGAIVTFNGDNLSAKTFVLPHKADLNTSFTKMAKILGPLEFGYVRLAFIFTCVDRFGIHGENETQEFAKHFPDVPLNGFWSLGEFCFGYTNLTDKHKKKSNAFSTSKGNQFFFQQASTYLFITYKK